MSHFYGQIHGSRGPATRCGHKASGVDAYVASWDGRLESEAYVQDGIDYVRVGFRPHHGTGTIKTLYDGPINPDAHPDHAPRQWLVNDTIQPIVYQGRG